ncbi:hypothetical protein F511_37035 [Dorcoceras hygrometricum]|uniref:Uncharacterized protein n=1 Tax=Dorcoceras hygrometricum TaxID=472368 RepID=A0A2Z7AJ89_9LAMI|nr:hypothetical protein F511_37035 [Dorcoceras hygrometricum]
MTRYEIPSSACTRRPDEIGADGFSSSSWPEQIPAARGGDGGGAQGRRRRTRAAAAAFGEEWGGGYCLGYTASRGPTTIVAPESQFRTCPSDHDSIGYPRMSASGESSTTIHRLLHASGSHPIPTPYDPKRVGKRVKVRHSELISRSDLRTERFTFCSDNLSALI